MHCPGIDILVVDNASPEPVDATISQHFPDFPVPLRVLRNTANIGAGANFLRCVEEARGDWLWILGDDDTVREDSLPTMIRAVEAHPDSLAICFSSVHDVHDTERNFIGRPALLAGIKSVGGYFFLSTNLYHRASMLREIRIGYVYNYSMVPIFCMLLAAIGDGRRVVESPKSVVNTTAPNEWSPSLYYLSIMTTIESLGDESDRRALWKLIYRPEILRYVAIDSIMRASSDRTGGACFYYDQTMFRNTYYLPPFSGTRLMVSIARQFVKAPRLAMRAMAFSARMTGKPKLYVDRRNVGDIAPDVHRRF